MKKITVLLLCFALLCTLNVAVFAAEEEKGNAVISLTVPDSHKITVTAEDAKVFYEGVSGEEFTVGRLSEPRLLIRAESGKMIQTVTLNGEDVTDALHGGYLDLAPVFEDKLITVTTEDEPLLPEETYTVKGTVTQNGLPLADVTLELRSTLKSTVADEVGAFAFTDVEAGSHSLTALKDGKVIGYLSFSLQAASETGAALLENGSYTVSIDKDGAGVELHLVLNEEGVLTLSSAETVEKPSLPLTGDGSNVSAWWLLLLAVGACIVVLESYRRKKC